MSAILTWAGRAVLALVLGVAVYGALDPHHNAEAAMPTPDVVEHVAFGYLLTVLTIVSLPRVSPWLIGGAYFAAGAGLEIGQVLGLISGTFQPRDLVANVGGVLAALAPMAIARYRK